MNQAIIDIGSNSMRLTVYETEQTSFKILFNEKIMAGLAGYIQHDCLSTEGISRACDSLLTFHHTLNVLGIHNPIVFATASLRNIDNTEEAVAAIQKAANDTITILSGEEEARLGYFGAMREFDVNEGMFADIGGASTELVSFFEHTPLTAESFRVGSLRLYRDCVRHILPGKDAAERIRRTICSAVTSEVFCTCKEKQPFICVGGTARAALRLTNALFSLPADNHIITAEQLTALTKRLLSSRREAADLLLKLMPERIHTAIPGLLILEHLVERLNTDSLSVSRYGVREGFLCRYLLP